MLCHGATPQSVGSYDYCLAALIHTNGCRSTRTTENDIELCLIFFSFVIKSAIFRFLKEFQMQTNFISMETLKVHFRHLSSLQDSQLCRLCLPRMPVVHFLVTLLCRPTHRLAIVLRLFSIYPKNPEISDGM